MSEQKLQAKILKWLKTEGYWTVKTIQCNINGVPDIIGCREGRFVGIEVKNGANGKVSPIQEYQLQRIRDVGGIAFVARSLDDVVARLSSSTP